MVFVMFFVIMPVMGNLWVDLDALRTALQIEYAKMVKINKQLREEQWLRSNNSDN